MIWKRAAHTAVVLAIFTSLQPAIATPVDCLGANCIVSDTGTGTSIRYHADNSGSFIDPELRDFKYKGVDHMYEQELEILFRDSSGNPLGSQPVDLDSKNIFLTSATADDSSNTIELLFEGSGLLIQQTLSLPGGTAARIDQSIRVTNTSFTTQRLSLFFYTDWDLNGIAGNDFSSYDPATHTFTQTDGSTSTYVRSLTTPDYFDSTLGSGETPIIGSGFSNNLKNRGGPIGPGDARNAFQYDMVLLSDQSRSIQIATGIPEPGTVMLMLAGLGALGLRRKYRGNPRS